MAAVRRAPRAWRPVLEEPKYVLYWYLACAGLVIPPHLFFSAIAERFTWLAVLAINALLAWVAIRMLASLAMYPGSSLMYARSTEEHIAMEIQQAVDSTVGDLLAHLRGSSEQPESSLATKTLPMCKLYLARIAQSLVRHVEENQENQEDDEDEEQREFVAAFAKLKELVVAWEDEHSSDDAKARLVQCCDQVLRGSRLLSGNNNNNNTSSSTSNIKDWPMASGRRLWRWVSTVICARRATGWTSVATTDQEQEDEEEAEAVLQESDEEEDDHSSANKNPIRIVWQMLAAQVVKLVRARRPFPGLLSFAWARHHLELHHHGRCELVHGGRIDLAVFSPSTASAAASASNKAVVVLCNPNAVQYEVYAAFPGGWIDFYRSLGVHVCVWNYRGFGRSSTFPFALPTPHAAREDVEHVLLHLEHTLGFTRVALHGESIGGIPACHAAAQTPTRALIADRTFASLHAIAESMVGSRATHMLHYATLGWEADNVDLFLRHAQPGNRLVLQDTNDAVIRHAASLKIGLARRLCPSSSCSSTVGDAASKMCALVESVLMRLHQRHQEPTSSAASEGGGGGGGEEQDAGWTHVAQAMRFVLVMDGGGTGQAFKSAVSAHLLQRPAAATASSSPLLDWFSSVGAFGDVSLVLAVLDDAETALRQPPGSSSSATARSELQELVLLIRQRCGGERGSQQQLLRGVLQPLTCGHSGLPPKRERDRIALFLTSWLNSTNSDADSMA